MTQVLFSSIDTAARTATFTVDGTPVTRPIAQEVTDETLADHLQALANGLIIEAEQAAAVATPGAITAAPVAEGTEFVYVEPVTEEEETPVEDVPAEEVPVEETPAEEVPAEPVVETPTEETPA